MRGQPGRRGEFGGGEAEMGLVACEGPGFGRKPATVENFRALPVRIGNKLATAAATLNQDVSEDEGNA